MSKIKDLDTISSLSDEELDAALEQAEPSSQVDLQAVQNEIDDYEKYKEQPLKTFGTSLASGLSFGLTDQALVKSGIYRPEELKKLREANPGAEIVGQATGIIAPLVTTGGASTAIGAGVKGAAKAGASAERVSAEILKNALKQTKNPTLAKEIIQKSVSKGLGSAVEGAAYGTGQLIREDALGQADFNAENLLSSVGASSVLGGTFGASLGIAGPVLRSISAKSGKAAQNLAKKYLDPKKDAMKLLGIDEKEIRKNPNIVDDVFEFVEKKIKLNSADKTQSLLEKTYKIQKSATNTLDEVYDKVGDAQLDRSIFGRIADKVEQDLIAGKEGRAAFKSFINPAKRIVKDLRADLAKQGPVTIKEVRRLRQDFDDLAKTYYKSLDPSNAAQAAFKTRSLLKDELNAAVRGIDENLANKLESANKDYYLSEKIIKALEKKGAKDNELLNLKDIALGGIFGAGFGIEGLLYPAARKFMESDLKRKLVVLINIERLNKFSDSNIANSVSSFFAKTKAPAKALSLNALVNSPLAIKDEETPKNKKEAFKNVVEKISKYKTDPELLSNEIGSKLMVIERAAPKTAEKMAETSIKAFNFIDSKLPKNMSDLILDKPFAKTYEPSSLEISKFERYLQVVDNPLSVLEEIKAGTLTREHVEALENVYPNIYNRLRVKVLDEVDKHPNMAYSKKIQLGILLNIPTDESLIPQNILALQQNFSQENQSNQGAVNSTVTGTSKLNIASRVATDVQKTQNRS